MSTVPLYGGSLSTQLPEGRIDVSNIRQVPDNQEVFLIEGEKKENDTSILFELLELVPEERKEAFKTHIEDVLGPGFEYVSLGSVQVSSIGGDAETCYVKHHGIVTFFALVRLEQVNTDILISTNVPFDTEDSLDDFFVARGGDISTKSLHEPFVTLAKSYSIFRIAVQNFRIIDSSIFSS